MSDQIFIPGLSAGEDLSSYKNCFVKYSAARTVVHIAADTDIPCGVLQNAPAASGQAATVVACGFTQLQIDDTSLTYGVLIGTAADGQGKVITVSDTTKYVLGHVVNPAAATPELCDAMINCINPTRAG